MASENPISVMLTIDVTSPYADLFKKFCGEYPLGPGKLFFVNCSSAISEGGFLRITVKSGENFEKESSFRVPIQSVLFINDVASDPKKVGF